MRNAPGLRSAMTLELSLAGPTTIRRMQGSCATKRRNFEEARSPSESTTTPTSPSILSSPTPKPRSATSRKCWPIFAVHPNRPTPTLAVFPQKTRRLSPRSSTSSSRPKGAVIPCTCIPTEKSPSRTPSKICSARRRSSPSWCMESVSCQCWVLAIATPAPKIARSSPLINYSDIAVIDGSVILFDAGNLVQMRIVPSSLHAYFLVYIIRRSIICMASTSPISKPKATASGTLPPSRRSKVSM
jgi:hypothetical protein